MERVNLDTLPFILSPLLIELAPLSQKLLLLLQQISTLLWFLNLVKYLHGVATGKVSLVMELPILDQSYTPRLVEHLKGKGFIRVAAGKYHTIDLGADGEFICEVKACYSKTSGCC